MRKAYHAHFFKEGDAIYTQSVLEHSRNVSDLAFQNSPLAELNLLAKLGGILHDVGKYSEAYQEYLDRAMAGKPVHRGEVTHSTAGGYLLEQMFPRRILTQMIQTAVFCHHGLSDSFRLEKGDFFLQRRLKEQGAIDNDQVAELVPEEELRQLYAVANDGMQQILEKIDTFIRASNTKKNEYGNRHFFLGMYERVLLSTLMDADCTDTACFMDQKALPEKEEDASVQAIWKQCIINLEEKLKHMKKSSRLNVYRREISDACMEAGKRPESLYRLTVPTGSGKTLSALRYALYHAETYGKRHIIYVAPFQSILEQNAEEIRSAVGDAGLVLEHHCNVLHESAEAEEQYRLLTENWDSKIIVTTAVQFLNTLFGGKSANIRRMHNILNSVIIFDEVQSLPVRITKMYNLAVNYLSVFGRSSVILCSATQPLFDELPEYKLLNPQNMVPDTWKYAKAFERTRICDETKRVPGGMSVNDLQEFIWEKTEDFDRILVIVNTKKCAKDVYMALKEKCQENACLLFHLSTNMYAENRKRVLKEVREALEGHKKVICISTQLIEAGVDLSCQCVIRSLAGLDSVIQAAGRCNRNGEAGKGYVYLIQMAADAERIDRLIDIRIAQECMRQVLHQFHMQPESFAGRLDSDQAIRRYYQLYFKRREMELAYSVSVEGVNTTLVELLSENTQLWCALPADLRKKYKGLLLKQAFQTAGEKFEVISEDGKIGVIVEREEKAKEQIAILQDPYAAMREKKAALRKLQPYSVGISEGMRRKLGSAVFSVCEGSVFVLNGDYYSEETGVSEEPEGMAFLDY